MIIIINNIIIIIFICIIFSQALDLDFNSPVNINCNNYPTTNCMLYLPSGFFAISPDQGDYSYLQNLYIVLVVIWVWYAMLWNYYVYVLYKDRCLHICKFISNVPIVKSITVILALAFWSTCHSWQMCSFWLSVGVINVHLVYETWAIAALMLIAQGIYLFLLQLIIIIPTSHQVYPPTNS